MEEVEKIIKLYRKLSKTQILAGGRIYQNVINTIWSQRNIETGKNVKYMRTHLVDDKFTKLNAILPVDVSQELLSVVSASEKYRAVLKDFPNGKENRKQLLEIWTKDHLSHSVDLTGLNVHGDVYTDVEFKSFAFSPDETKIMYIAEKKLATREPFYKRKSDKDDTTNENVSTTTKGEEYVFRQDWGEQLTGKYSSVIAVYDLEQDNVNVLEGIPEDVCPGQGIWSPDGSSIVGVALESEPRKYGLIYNSNRFGVIFQLDLNGTYRILSQKGKSVTAPRFSPDGKYLIWLERESGGPHHDGMRLMRLERKELIGDIVNVNTNPSIVVDVVQHKTSISNNRTFFGLFNTSLPERCWADNKRLILSTPQNHNLKTYIVNIETGTITELETNENDSTKPSSYLVLDVYKNKLLVCRKNYCLYDQCLTAILPEEGNEDNIKWTEITEKVPIAELKNTTYEYLDLEQETNDEIKNFSAMYLGPKCGQSKETPLIVWPHGGPHSAFFNTFGLEPSILMCLGYAIVFVNYRGSIGNGQASIHFLLGRVGDTDVKDCVFAAKKCLDMYPWLNPERMALIGGSHGGFLVHHLSGQYPDMFKVVVSRNPVIDVASMNIISDIPDWAAVEAGSCYNQRGPISNELLVKMRQVSPIQHAHKIKAATYLMLGSKDLRVPMSQGLELYYRLKANNVPVKVNVYDDNHTLSSVPNEMDHLINGALWLMKHI